MLLATSLTLRDNDNESYANWWIGTSAAVLAGGGTGRTHPKEAFGDAMAPEPPSKTLAG